MILIAPDKFKGTLSAEESAEIIANILSDAAMEYIAAPMADGGEGTAKILSQGAGWIPCGRGYFNHSTHTAAVDSNAYIGPGCFSDDSSIFERSSAPLGKFVRYLTDELGAEKIIIGIGGTHTCDGGRGFLEALGILRTNGTLDTSNRETYRSIIQGLSDVKVPLLPTIEGEASALTFAPQKGATDEDMPLLAKQLRNLSVGLATDPTPFDGSGGGLGYAIASVIGAETMSGVDAVLQHHKIDWERISLIITGEGSIDEQTKLGKVVGRLTEIGKQRGIPVVRFGGKVQENEGDELTFACDRFLTDEKLTKQTAAIRLHKAVESALDTIRELSKR